MKDFFKKNFVLITAFVLPLILIMAVVVSVRFPFSSVSTGYDFLYARCEGNGPYPFKPGLDCGTYLQQYSVKDDKLTVSDLNQNNLGYKARLFLHDTEKDESREITLTEAQALRLDGLLTSPDGVSVSSGWDRGGEFFIFGGSSSYGYYLTKGKNRRRLNLINNDRYSNDRNFKFLGWALPGRN